MLLRFDPFRELDRLSGQLFETGVRSVPMNAVRRNDRLVVTFDLPGVDPASIDLTVERNQLALTAERRFEHDEGDEVLVAERPSGTFSRRVFLGESLDTQNIEADYHDGVLYVSIPVAAAARPKRVAISSHEGTSTEPIEATSRDSS